MKQFYIHTWRQDLKRDRYSSASDRRYWFNQRGCWWLRRHSDDVAVGNLDWQLVMPGGHPGITLRLDDDDEPLHFHIGLGLLTLYLSLNNRWARKLADRHLKPRYSDRELSLRFFDGGVWWMLWMRDDEHRSTDPKWRRGVWRPLDTFLGRMRFNKRVLSMEKVSFFMDNRRYSATVELSEDSWKRPRWPTVKRHRRAEVEVKNPPMFAGKGENSWDQDDDCIYSMTTDAATVHEAIEKYRAAVLTNRKRYGMPAGLETT